MSRGKSEARVSQGGEGRIRRVTPEEQRRTAVKRLCEGRSDLATQRGWDLAVEEIIASLRQGDHAEARRAAEYVEQVFGR